MLLKRHPPKFRRVTGLWSVYAISAGRAAVARAAIARLCPPAVWADDITCRSPTIADGDTGATEQRIKYYLTGNNLRSIVMEARARLRRASVTSGSRCTPVISRSAALFFDNLRASGRSRHSALRRILDFARWELLLRRLAQTSGLDVCVLARPKAIEMSGTHCLKNRRQAKSMHVCAARGF